MESKKETYYWLGDETYYISSYVIPDDWRKWYTCLDCGRKPRVRERDNGRKASCVCGYHRYTHKKEAKAKPIMDYVRETGSHIGYNKDDLRIERNKLAIIT